jgi:dihydroxyacetone kinase-like predicted kinase
MTSAAGATRWAEVTTAARDTRDVHKGDVIGLMGGELALSGSSVFEVACGLLDRMLIGGGELVTVVTGAGADADLGRRLADYLAAVRPDVDVSLHVGGQPHYPVLLGVE